MEQANLHQNVPPADTAVGSHEKRSLSSDSAAPTKKESRGRPKEISRSQLINKLNHLNFIEQPLFVVFRHRQYPRTVSLKAKPHPCQDEHLTCTWQQPAAGVADHPDLYEFEKVIIPDGRRYVTVFPQIEQLDSQTIALILPETCSATDARKTRRHRARDIQAYVTQNGALFFGAMTDFSAFSFRLRVQTAPPQTFDWIAPDLPVHVILFDGKNTLYTGDCRILKQGHGNRQRDWVLEPISRNQRRFPPKEFRCHRHRLVPFPTISFSHPFSRQMISLNVLDISGSGLAVEEQHAQAVLFPGMVIPGLEIRFADGSCAPCTAQVIYSRNGSKDPDDGMLHCGIAILDMPIDDHIRMLALLQQARDKNTHICNRVDLDDLWDFFFETGFIYPGKYEFIEKNKDQIKRTYEKLYTQNPKIARHFIYQKNGRILGHVAMLRFYQRTWLIHHHAAINSVVYNAGLIVLNQIGQFANDSHRLPSLKMQYLACFYRPDNKFPNRVFGGARQSIGNQLGCSTDHFAYFHLGKKPGVEPPLPHGWELRPATSEDLLDFKSLYDTLSGGLMIRAMGLYGGEEKFAELTATYGEIGLIRDRHIFALEENHDVKALIMVNLADLGLNMSDLTNSIAVFVLNRNGLSGEIIESVCRQLTQTYSASELPVLLFPSADAKKLKIPMEKEYVFWALNTDYGDDYFRYLKRLMKFIK